MIREAYYDDDFISLPTGCYLSLGPVSVHFLLSLNRLEFQLQITELKIGIVTGGFDEFSLGMRRNATSTLFLQLITVILANYLEVCSKKLFCSRLINSDRNLAISSSIFRISESNRSRMLENSESMTLKSPILIGIFLLAMADDCRFWLLGVITNCRFITHERRDASFQFITWGLKILFWSRGDLVLIFILLVGTTTLVTERAILPL